MLDLGPGVIGKPARLGLEPSIHFVGRSQALVNVAGLVYQVQHHAIGHGLVVLVGVDVGAENLHRGLLVLSQQGCAGKADKHGVGENGFHGLVEFAALCAVRFVYKDEEFPLGAKVRRQTAS